MSDVDGPDGDGNEARATDEAMEANEAVGADEAMEANEAVGADEAMEADDVGGGNESEDADGDGDADEAMDTVGGRDADDGSRVADADDRPDVPPDPEAAVADDEHALPLEDLRYPTFALPSGTVGDDGGVAGERELDREAMAAWLEDLAGALTSHDVAFEAPDGRVTLGVAPEGVDVSFDPDEEGAGDLALTFRLRAKTMVVNDPGDTEVGARGGLGFVPLAMLTDDADPDSYRCYNWIDDPRDG